MKSMHDQLRRQIRAGRELLGLNQADVAKIMDVSLSKISRAENGDTKSIDTLLQMKAVLDRLGIEISEDGGVRPKQSKVERFVGAEGFRHFMDDVHATVKMQGGLICVHNVDPSNWIKWLGAEWNAAHTERMQQITKKFDFRITVRQNDDNHIGKHAEYRWLPEHSWNDQSFYAYGDKLALLLFLSNEITIHVIHSQQFADGFRSLFAIAWDHIPPIKGKAQK